MHAKGVYHRSLGRLVLNEQPEAGKDEEDYDVVVLSFGAIHDRYGVVKPKGDISIDVGFVFILTFDNFPNQITDHNIGPRVENFGKFWADQMIWNTQESSQRRGFEGRGGVRRTTAKNVSRCICHHLILLAGVNVWTPGVIDDRAHKDEHQSQDKSPEVKCEFCTETPFFVL